MEADAEHEGTKMRAWWWYLPSFQVRWHYLNIFRLSLKGRASFRASLIAQSVKNLPAVQETGVRSLGWEDPLEKEMTIHSSIGAWKISWIDEPGGLQSMGSQRVGHDWANTLLKGSVIFWARGKGTTEEDRVRKRQKIKEGSGTSPVVQQLRLCSPCRGSGFHSWLGNWILHAATKIEDLVCHN